MTLMIPETGEGPLSGLIETVESELIGMAADLRRIRDQLQEGTVAGQQETARRISEIKFWLRLAAEVEAKRAERQRQEEGFAAGFAIDFEAARSEIGGRLDRLRRARRAEGDPG